jgi:hypothetical protein
MKRGLEAAALFPQAGVQKHRERRGEGEAEGGA